MTPILLHAESTANADMYAATGFLAGDPFGCLIDGDSLVLLVGDFERPRAQRESRATEVVIGSELGLAELFERGISIEEIERELTVRLLDRYGVRELIVPDWLPVALADRIRAEGIELDVRGELMAERRRSKSAADLASTIEAQRVTSASMELIRSLLRASTPDADGALMLDGSPLTSERVQGEIRVLWAREGCEGETPIVAGGVQSADGHELGRGPLRAGEPIVCDLFPRHTAGRHHADMTRTFCVGEPPAQLVEMHAAACAALEEARSQLRPGVLGSDLNRRMCEVLRDHGHGSQLFPRESIEGAKSSVCDHSLGHGVGLEIHEQPMLGRSGHSPLVVGDVVTIEPGLYDPAFGGVRVEDLCVITESGATTLTSFPFGLSVES